VLNEIPAQIQVIIVNAFFTILTDESAHRAELCVAWQRTALRNPHFHWLELSKVHLQ
jgi:hypothetical protein